ncbi:hypothetical protein O9992_20395 [Vibrio lentus]|nr:hypothetical protein [Vibrio lentus]
MRMMSTGEQSDDGSKRFKPCWIFVLDGDWKPIGVARRRRWYPAKLGLVWFNKHRVGRWHWPIPKYYEQLDVMTLGYKNTSAFPLH